MIFHLINSFFISILFIDFLERKFPNQTQNFFVNFLYNSIYLYSKLQIQFYKLNIKVNKFIENNPILLKIREKIDSAVNLNFLPISCHPLAWLKN